MSLLVLIQVDAGPGKSAHTLTTLLFTSFQVGRRGSAANQSGAASHGSLTSVYRIITEWCDERGTGYSRVSSRRPIRLTSHMSAWRARSIADVWESRALGRGWAELQVQDRKVQQVIRYYYSLLLSLDVWSCISHILIQVNRNHRGSVIFSRMYKYVFNSYTFNRLGHYKRTHAHSHTPRLLWGQFVIRRRQNTQTGAETSSDQLKSPYQEQTKQRTS